MIPNRPPIPIELSHAFEEFSFGLDIKDPTLFIILQDKLYSDKVAAPIREYVTNARDAHVEAGLSPADIVVTLPTPLDSVFRVRDFGFGLSRTQVIRTYIIYARSTKRDSNRTTGQLGLGSKSGFAYGAQFTITSYHGGIKSIYTAIKDSSRKGKLLLIDEVPTTETGIEISFPVAEGDTGKFITGARNILHYFADRPKVVHAPAGFYTPIQLPFPGSTWWMTTPNQETPYGRRTERHTSSHIIMGDVAYPIQPEKLTELSAQQQAVLEDNIQIRVPIGAVDFHAGREQLEYSETTALGVQAALDGVIADTRDILLTQLAQATTFTSAWNQAVALAQICPHMVSSLDVLFSWKGQSLTWDTKELALRATCYHLSDVRLKYGKRERCRLERKVIADGCRVGRLILSHFRLPYRSERIRQELQRDSTPIQLVLFSSDRETETLQAMPDRIPGLVWLHDLPFDPKLMPPRQARAASAKQVRHKFPVYCIFAPGDKPSGPVDFATTQAVYYVERNGSPGYTHPTRGFIPVGTSFAHAQAIGQLLQAPLVAITATQAQKAPKNFLPLGKQLMPVLRSCLGRGFAVADLVDYASLGGYEVLWAMLHLSLPKRHLVSRLLATPRSIWLKTGIDPKCMETLLLLSGLMTEKGNLDLAAIRTGILQQYPLVHYLCSSRRWTGEDWTWTSQNDIASKQEIYQHYLRQKPFSNANKVVKVVQAQTQPPNQALSQGQTCDFQAAEKPSDQAKVITLQGSEAKTDLQATQATPGTADPQAPPTHS